MELVRSWLPARLARADTERTGQIDCRKWLGPEAENEEEDPDAAG